MTRKTIIETQSKEILSHTPKSKRPLKGGGIKFFQKVKQKNQPFWGWKV